MFCKQCGKDLGAGEKRFCPYCGAVVSSYGMAAAQQAKTKPSRTMFLGVAGLILLAAIVIMLAMNLFGNSAAKKEAGSQTIASNEKAMPEKTVAEMLLGTWKGDELEITFNDKGNARIGNSGVSFGGEYVSYELLDENTLYLTGENLPVGITMDCYVDESCLILNLNGEKQTFYKK